MKGRSNDQQKKEEVNISAAALCCDEDSLIMHKGMCLALTDSQAVQVVDVCQLTSGTLVFPWSCRSDFAHVW